MKQLRVTVVVASVLALLGFYRAEAAQSTEAFNVGAQRELSQIACAVPSLLNEPNETATGSARQGLDATKQHFTPGDWRLSISTLRECRRDAGHQVVISIRSQDSSVLTPLVRGRTNANGRARFNVTPMPTLDWKDVQDRLVCSVDEPGLREDAIEMHGRETRVGPFARARIQPRTGFARRVQLVDASGQPLNGDLILEHAPKHDRGYLGRLTHTAIAGGATLHASPETNAVLHGIARGVGTQSIRVQEIFALGPDNASLKLTLESAGAISGTVVNLGGHPLADVGLELTLKASDMHRFAEKRYQPSYAYDSSGGPGEVPPGGNVVALTETDANGHFEATGLRAGDYDVRAASDNSLLGTVAVADAPVQLDWNRTWVTLEPTEPVRGSEARHLVQLELDSDPVGVAREPNPADLSASELMSFWYFPEASGVYEVVRLQETGARFLLRSGATYELKLSRRKSDSLGDPLVSSIKVPTLAQSFTARVDCP